MITPDDPRHGERRGYRAGCRESCCRVPHVRYLKQYKVDRESGRPPRQVDAAPIRAHLEQLTRTMTLAGVALAAGLSERTVRHARNADVVHASTARSILAVRGTRWMGTTYVNAVGTSRRLQALSTLGYSSRALALATGIEARHLDKIRGGQREHVRADTARRVGEIYDRLAMHRPVGSNRGERSAITLTRRAAERNGWAPPLAWDDETIDDPTAEPCGAGYKESSLAAQIRELADMGLSEAAIAGRLGAKSNTVERVLDRARREAA